MEPFTLGLLSVSAAGGALAIVGGLGYAGFKINELAVTVILELSKYGAIFYLLKKMMILL